jgi:hypothetical protein
MSMEPPPNGLSPNQAVAPAPAPQVFPRARAVRKQHAWSHPALPACADTEANRRARSKAAGREGRRTNHTARSRRHAGQGTGPTSLLLYRCCQNTASRVQHNAIRAQGDFYAGLDWLCSFNADCPEETHLALNHDINRQFHFETVRHIGLCNRHGNFGLPGTGIC